MFFSYSLLDSPVGLLSHSRIQSILSTISYITVQKHCISFAIFATTLVSFIQQPSKSIMNQMSVSQTPSQGSPPRQYIQHPSLYAQSSPSPNIYTPSYIQSPYSHHETPISQFPSHSSSQLASMISCYLLPQIQVIITHLKFIIIIQKTYLLKKLPTFMKSKEIKSPKGIKINKRISEVETDIHKNRGNLQKSQEEYLSPMHIKLPKNKGKNKKDSKNSKNTQILQQRTTKRKQKKKVLHTFNGNTMITDNIELKDTMKDEKYMLKLKSKTTQKTFRNSSKNNSYKNNTSSYQDLLTSPKNYSKLTHSLKNFNPSTSHIKMPQQQYLFLGDEFYLVNNYHPTKRLLNTFRQVCNYQNSDSKYIMQDKGQKLNKKLQIKKNNIFLSARKQIQQKQKCKKIIRIQRWWKYMMRKHRLYQEKSNPEIIPLFNISPIKYNYQNDEINQVTPIKPYLQQELLKQAKSPFEANLKHHPKSLNDDIQIISFNSSDQISAKVKKIQFSKQDISKMLMKPFSLPQNHQIDPIQNQDIFNNYAKFRSQQLNQQFMSGSSQQNILSPQKDDSQSNESSLNDIQQKSDSNLDLLKQFQQATQIKQLIEHRILFQKGQIKSLQTNNNICISTSILTVHNTLVSFFHYYINQYKQEFLSLINMPFGHSVYSRLRALRGIPIPEEIEEDQTGVVYGLKDIIDDQKFQEYFNHIVKRDGKVINSFAKANLQLEKIHFKAVLDHFNEELNQYRPYCQIDGVPYPWNHSWKALTFYYVTEQNIAEVFQKTQLKVLKATSSLCGIILLLPNQRKDQPYQRHLQLPQFMQNYQKSTHGLIRQHNQSKQVKFIHQQLKAQPFLFDSQAFTSILLQTSNQLTDHLILELAHQLLSIATADYTC